MKRFLVFSYPKLTFYFLAIVAAYFVFQIPTVHDFISSFDRFIYIAIFIGGLLFSAGFTTPIATGFFLNLQTPDPFMAAVVAAMGALIADMGIFSFIRLTFMDEFKLLKHTSFIRHLSSGVRGVVPAKLRSLLVYVLAGLIIASPLPDELGVALLAGFTKVHPYGFMFISYMGNVLGIFVLLTL